MRPWSQLWFDDCMLWYGTVLRGRYTHWCKSGIPISEHLSVFQYCKCFNCKCGRLMVPKYYPHGRGTMEIHDDVFECPKQHWWNFWKHDWYNLIGVDAPKPNGRII